MNVLVINCGSSSIKYQLFDMATEQVMAKGLVERIGESRSGFRQESTRGELSFEADVPDHERGFQLLAEGLLHDEYGVLRRKEEVAAVGHRVVHGGEAFVESQLITPEVIKTIEEFCSLAPLHNPPNLVGIREAMRFLPSVPHVAVFDTAFHQSMPKRAYVYALPYEFYEEKRIRRYGFHGTSHRFVTQRAAEILGIQLDRFNCITCHLGNGCSLTAVQGGKSVDTSLGMTPLEGLVMGTRSGDIDPAIVFHLCEREGMTLAEVDTLLNKKSGLLGLSGVSNDMREIFKAAEEGNARAQLAIDVFAYRAKKYIGAYFAVLGRVDAVIFTGGIGENAVEIRARICEGLDSLGLKLDPDRNVNCRAEEGIISPENSPVRIMVVPTNEELLIARDTQKIASRCSRTS